VASQKAIGHAHPFRIEHVRFRPLFWLEGALKALFPSEDKTTPPGAVVALERVMGSYMQPTRKGPPKINQYYDMPDQAKAEEKLAADIVRDIGTMYQGYGFFGHSIKAMMLPTHVDVSYQPTIDDTIKERVVRAYNRHLVPDPEDLPPRNLPNPAPMRRPAPQVFAKSTTPAAKAEPKQQTKQTQPALTRGPAKPVPRKSATPGKPGQTKPTRTRK
jgi:hypothetical protein